MNIAVKIAFGAQFFDDANQLFHGVIGRYVHGGREEQSFDVIAFIKIEDKPAQFVDRGGSAGFIEADAIKAVFAIVDAVVAHQNLE